VDKVRTVLGKIPCRESASANKREDAMSFISEGQQVISFLREYAAREMLEAIGRPNMGLEDFARQYYTPLTVEQQRMIARFVGEYSHALGYREPLPSLFGEEREYSASVGTILLAFYKRGGDAQWALDIAFMLETAIRGNPETISRSEAAQLEQSVGF